MLAVTSLYWIAHHLYTPRVALIAALLLTLSPFAISYSQEVRMYSWLMLWVIWAYYFTDRLISAESRTILYGIGLVLCGLTLLYSHGGSFLLLPTLFFHGVLLIKQHSITKLRLLTWLGALLLLSVLYLPWLQHSYEIRTFIGQNHIFSWENISNTLFIVVFGFQQIGENIQHLTVTLLLAALFICIVFAERARTPLLAYFLGPLLIAIAISILLQPILFYRSLAFTTPIILLGIALCLAQFNRLSLYGMAITLLLCATLAQAIQRPTLPSPKGVIEYALEQPSKPLVLSTLNHRVAWGICWYALQPGNVNPLNTRQPICRSQDIMVTTIPPSSWHRNGMLLIEQKGETAPLGSHQQRLPIITLDGFSLSEIRSR